MITKMIKMMMMMGIVSTLWIPQYQAQGIINIQKGKNFSIGVLTYVSCSVVLQLSLHSSSQMFLDFQTKMTVEHLVVGHEQITGCDQLQASTEYKDVPVAWIQVRV